MNNEHQCQIIPVCFHTIKVKCAMVFAPKEAASSIGWGKRIDSDSMQSRNEKHDEKVIIEKSKKKKKQPKRKIIDSELKKTPVNKRRTTATEIGIATEESCNIDIQDKGQEQSYYGPQYYGPQLPSTEHCALPKPTQKLPPGVYEELQLSNEVPSTVISFEIKDESQCQRIAINGRARLQAIEGSFDILGYRLSTASKKSIVIESPDWMSALCIEPLRRESCNRDSDSLKGEISSSKSRAVSRIKITSLSEDSCTFELSSPQKINSVKITDQWKSVAENLGDDKKLEYNDLKDSVGCRATLVCGAKGTGKSTFVRFLTNMLLSPDKDCDNHDDSKKVAILDCDVGQPEFSAPGILSLTVVKKPLLTPPHAHIVCGKSRTKSGRGLFEVADGHQSAFFYGFTTSKVNPIKYMSAVRSLMQTYHQLCKEEGSVELIVNTDGWVKGMGYEILSSIIEATNPNQIVQIIGSTKAKFFDLFPHASNDRRIHVVGTAVGKLYDPLSLTPPISRATSYSSMQSLNDVQTDINISQTGGISPIASSLTRSLRFCTYFLGGFEAFLSTGAAFHCGGLLDEGHNIALQLSALKPYRVPFDSIECIIFDEDGNESIREEDASYEEFNLSIVGLCSKNTSTLHDLRICHGLGIVRSIDWKSRMLYIITPVDPSTLQSKVSCLLKGQLMIPTECTFCGDFSESFPHLSFDGASVGIGGDTMKSKNAYIKK